MGPQNPIPFNLLLPQMFIYVKETAKRISRHDVINVGQTAQRTLLMFKTVDLGWNGQSELTHRYLQLNSKNEDQARFFQICCLSD